MIAQLSGRLVQQSEDQLVLDVHGVGYLVYAPLSTLQTLPPIGETVTLKISTRVREDAITLYGFQSEQEADLFEELNAVANVGPRLALNVLSTLKPPRFVRAINREEIEVLTEVSGVGRKTARRLIAELKDRLEAWSVHPDESAAPAGTTGVGGGPGGEAVEALVALGFERREVERALADIDEDDSMEAEVLVREALKRLNPER